MSVEVSKNQSPVGDDAIAYVNSFLTKEEKAEVALEVQLMEEGLHGPQNLNSGIITMQQMSIQD